MLGDPELLEFRRGYYELLVSLFWKEPARELLAELARAAAGRVAGARRIHPLLGDGWEEIARFCATREGDLAEAVREEYVRLFVGPFHPVIYLYESWYLTGCTYDRPLAALRGLLAELGIEKTEGYGEPEDFLAFELEVMRVLLARQAAARGREEEARAVDEQTRFLKRHLLVWGPSAARDVAGAAGAAFYRGVGHLLTGLLELERELVKDRGDEPVGSLAEARERFARAGGWKGPLVDFSWAPGEPEPPAGGAAPP